MTELYMAETTIGDDAIDIVAKFPNLKKLRLAKNQITGQGMSKLPQLAKLEELDLSECAQLTDADIAPLGEMKNLKKLNLWRVNISDEGIKPLQSLTNLQSLNLDNTRLTDDGMPYLSELNNLSFLHLGSTLITDDGLSHLEKLTRLADLKVTRTAVSAAGVAKLKEKLPDTEIQLKYIEGQ